MGEERKGDRGGEVSEVCSEGGAIYAQERNLGRWPRSKVDRWGQYNSGAGAGSSEVSGRRVDGNGGEDEI